VTDVVVAPYPELLSVQFCTNAENFMLLSPSEQFLLFFKLSSCTRRASDIITPLTRVAFVYKCKDKGEVKEADLYSAFIEVPYT